MTPQPTAPPRIPNYRLLRIIGQGTYGQVWLALDVFDRWAAVKVVWRDPEAGARSYEQEFRGLKRYVTVAGSDQRLMPITNVGEDAEGGFFHYAMELADDAATGLPLPPIEPEHRDRAAEVAVSYRPLTLKERLRGGRLTPEACLLYGIALAESLEYLHQHGLVHRDVKPSNIILVGGRAKLADIGLVTNPDATLVSMAGTPDFVPLHGAGRAGGDIFALGKVLYLMANGRPLTDFPELIEGHLELPAKEREALAELAAIYDRACEPDPANRYGNAGQLRADLERLKLAGSVLRLRRQEQAAQQREAEFRRGLRIVGVLGGVAVLVVLVVVFRSWQAEATLRTTLIALENRQLARMNRRVQGWAATDWAAIRQAAGVRSDELMVQQAAATLSGLDARSLGHWAGADATSAAFSSTGDLVLSGYGTNNASLITQATNRIELPVAGEGKVAWAGVGEPLIFQIDAGQAVLRALRSGQVRRSFGLAAGEVGYVTHAPVTALSMDGTRAAAVLAHGKGRRLVLWDAENGIPLAETNFTANVLAFAPDQSRLAAGHEDGSVTVFRLNPFERESELPAALGPNPVQALAFGKDLLVPLAGPSTEPRWLLAAGDLATGIVVWELATRRPRSFCRGSTWEVQSLAFHPDGVTLASAGRNGVHFWDVATGQALLWASENGNKTRALAFSHDGARLAAGSSDESIRSNDISLWELEPDRGVQQLRGLTAPIRKVSFSPDGQRLVALSDEWRLGVWEVPSGRLLRIFELAASSYADSAGCAVDAEHRWLAFAAGTSARLFDLNTGRTLATWELPRGRRNDLKFTSDGRLFLGRADFVPGSTALRQWSLYELTPGEPARRQHHETGTHDATINLALTAEAARLVVLSKNLQNGSNHLAAIEVSSGRELWRRATGNSISWEVLRVDPTGTRCAAIFGPVGEGVVVRRMALLNVTNGQTLSTIDNCHALGPMGTEYTGDQNGTTRWGIEVRGGLHPSLVLSTDSSVSADSQTFSPDGTGIACGDDKGSVFVANLPEVRRRLGGLRRSVGRDPRP